MSVSVKIAHVYEMMRKNECPFWRITGTTGYRNLIDENDDDENVDKGIDLLQDAIEMIEDNHIYIVISDKTKKDKAKGGRNFQQYEFKVNLHRAESANMGMAGNNGMLAMLIAQMEKNAELNRQLIAEQKDRQFDALQKQIEELKHGDKFNNYQPYLDKIFDVKRPTHGIASTGTEDKEVDETIIDKQKRTREALKRLQKIDGHLPDTLTNLANFAEKNPDDYKFYVNKIASM